MICPSINNRKGKVTPAAYPNLVTENLGRRPRDTSLVFVDTIDEEGSPPSDVVDGILNDGFDSGRFNDNVESEWMVLLQLVPLRLRVLPDHQ